MSRATTKQPAAVGSGSGAFAPTRWSVVLAAKGPTPGTQARRALGDLFLIYWSPLYFYSRRCWRHSHEEAEDLVQQFFTRLLDKGGLTSAERSKGKFRSFLLASFKHFLANDWDRKQTKKRGGGRRLLPLDLSGVEDRYRSEPFTKQTPEGLFNRQWVVALLEQVLARLQDEHARDGKGALFEGLKKSLTGEMDAPSYLCLAEDLHMTEGAVKTAAHRLRKRYKWLLRDEIAQTVAGPDEIEEEIRELFNTL
jgi:RNA polymerase sigma-70 factor (ECF subfamily)